jgi:hypothetical protein
MFLPFRKGSYCREYKELLAQIGRLQGEVGRIERMRETVAGPDSGLSPSEQSIIFLRSELTGDDLAMKREQLETLSARVADLVAR